MNTCQDGRVRMKQWLKRKIKLATRVLDIVRFGLSFVDFQRRAKYSSRPELPVLWRDRYACLNDATPVTGFDHHYIYHLAWAARKLVQQNPQSHIDISSSLYFSALMSAHTKISFLDYRPANIKLDNLDCGAVDLKNLAFGDGSIRSLSCMHVVEHIGLGRYGDDIDPDGDLRAMRELQRVLAPEGTLLFVVPVGKRRVQFNAHRIYAPEEIVATFNSLTLTEFSLITDNLDDGILEHANFELAASQHYGCGCFYFTRES